MKSCPTCNRTYPDDTLAFCLVDGSVLSAPYDHQAARPYSRPHDSEYPTMEMSNAVSKTNDTIPSLSAQPLFIQEAGGSSSSVKRSNKRWLIVSLLVSLAVIVGLVIGFGWSRWFGGNNSVAKQSGNENINSATPKPSASAAPSATPQSTPTPKSTPSPVKKIDVTGTWTGTFANRDGILFINSQDGDSFSGILKNSKGAIVAVSGHINSETRQISIQENRVVQAASEGPDWILGSESGSLSADGKRMSGSGKDKAGHAYTWTFSK